MVHALALSLSLSRSLFLSLASGRLLSSILQWSLAIAQYYIEIKITDGTSRIRKGLGVIRKVQVVGDSLTRYTIFATFNLCLPYDI